MRKLIAALLIATIMLSGTSAFARPDDKAGDVYYSDIVAYMFAKLLGYKYAF